MKNRAVKGLAAAAISTLLFAQSLAPAFASANGYVVYTVVSGDSLWKISTKYGVSIQEITELNLLNGTNILVGQRLKIPVSTPQNDTVYTVKSGDTLWKIAVAHDTSIQAIVDANKIDPNQYLVVGQKLQIPTTASEPETPSSTEEKSTILYTVVSGDTLWKIAEKYKLTIKEIADINKIDPNSMLFVGQKLNIPAVSNNTQPTDTQPSNTEPSVSYVEHIVQKGDNAWDLSIKYGIPQSEVLQANGLTDKSVLYIGQKLIIPVHHIPVTSTPGPQYGEYLDWWTQAQYVFPIGAKAKVTDLATGKSYNIIRSYGAFHADCEPLTAQDASIMYEIWGNKWSWQARASVVEVNGRKIAASVTNMPHDIENIKDNQFNGHFDIHFLNSTQHKDNKVSQEHQTQIKKAAGIK